MALDGITLHFIKDELAEKLIGARVERVNQPSSLNWSLTCEQETVHINCLCRQNRARQGAFDLSFA